MDFIGSGGNSSNITESDSNKTMLVGSRNITYRNRNHTVQVATLGDMEAIPEPYQSCLTGLYIGTAVVAIVANVLALTILITKKRSSADLRKYLINLAISDMSMAAFSLPFAYSDMMYGYWQFPLFWCPISHFISTCSVCVSIFTLTGIGIERSPKESQ
ncbi:tachykinin-like peptides receptor 99D [Oppia nitens]|uniref:tachykinin-like peptides receptor 99D n=1 Tax=Oppia nitens TaxID=1686743 RepID=UPI0023DBF8DE|nr:tachykinin-like peptides receptor 99D [Oppia nitens]